MFMICGGLLQKNSLKFFRWVFTLKRVYSIAQWAILNTKKNIGNFRISKCLNFEIFEAVYDGISIFKYHQSIFDMPQSGKSSKIGQIHALKQKNNLKYNQHAFFCANFSFKIITQSIYLGAIIEQPGILGMGRVKTRPEAVLANLTRPEQFLGGPEPTHSNCFLTRVNFCLIRAI